MFVLYEISTGRAHSQSSEPFENPDPSKYDISETQLSGIWNEVTHDFEPRPIDKRKSLGDFIMLFTEQERDDLIEATKYIKKAATFVEVIQLIGQADLNSDFIIDSVNMMESAGIIGLGRAGVILNG